MSLDLDRAEHWARIQKDVWLTHGLSDNLNEAIRRFEMSESTLSVDGQGGLNILRMMRRRLDDAST